MMILKIISLFIWLLLIPFCIGLLPVLLMREEDRSFEGVFLSGYIVMFALFELIGIPAAIIAVYHSFSILSGIFTAAAVFLSGLALAITFFKRKKGYFIKTGFFGELKKYGVEEKLYFLVFLLLAGYQLYMLFTHASFDGDDAYYGVQGLIAQQKDILYRINPYTGTSFPLDTRHCLALIPVWEAFVGKMSGIHATIIAHSVVPLILLPLTYLVYLQIGRKLFAKKKEMVPVFMVLMALFQMFGNVSIYTGETFLLTRTWQGKSIAANFMIPAVFWIFLCLFERKTEEKEKTGTLCTSVVSDMGYYVLLAALNLAAGISSSLAVLLTMLLTMGLSFLFTIKERRAGIFIKAGFSCIPGAAYVLTYLLISH